MMSAAWRPLEARIYLCLLLFVVYSRARYSVTLNTEAPYYGGQNNSARLGPHQPIRGYSAAFARRPWLGRVVPSAASTDTTRCSVACVKEQVFISASRCLLGMTIGVAAVQYKDLIFETKALITPGERYRTRQAFEDIGVLVVHENKSLKAWDTIQPVSLQRSGANYSWFQQFEVVKPKQADYMVVAFDPKDPEELLYELECYPGLRGCQQLLYREPQGSWENNMRPEYYHVPCLGFCSFDEFNVDSFEMTDEYEQQCRLNIWIEGAPVVSVSSPILLGVTSWGPGYFTLQPEERYVVGLAVPNSAAYAAAVACADAILRGAELNDAVCEDF